MKIIKKSNLIHNISIKHKDIGFVPTMGALHEGHISLIKKSKEKSKKTIVSIFVNPKQFNKKKDFATYPNNLRNDLSICKKLKVDYVFIPNSQEIYRWNDKKILTPKIDNIMEEKFRKGHLNGVLAVMSKFLSIIKCSKIYMGKKDYQQLNLIKNLIKLNKIKCSIVECKTIRMKNGGALSSRNLLLSNDALLVVGKVYRFLKLYKKHGGGLLFVRSELGKIGVKKIDYIKLINLLNFKEVKKISSNTNIFIAYYLNGIRLIDNL